MLRLTNASPLIVAISLVAVGVPQAHAVSDCAFCEEQGGVWLTGSLGDFCMKKLEPILGPVLEPIPEVPEPDFELEPGWFNEAPGMGSYDTPASPSMVGGAPITLRDEFVLWEPGQNTISDGNGVAVGGVVLGDNQIAFGAIADWNGLTDLVLYTVLEASLGRQPNTLDLTQVDSHPVVFTGINSLQQALGQPTILNETLGLSVSFEGVAFFVPEPSAAALLVAASGLLCCARRRF